MLEGSAFILYIQSPFVSHLIEGVIMCFRVYEYEMNDFLMYIINRKMIVVLRQQKLVQDMWLLIQ